MMKKKKNRFWLFLLSLCPGAGHMYLGFMKMGLSFMIGFIFLCVLTDLTGLGAFAAVAVIVYIYALFHANNLGGLDDEQFYAMEDQYLLGLDGISSGGWRLDRKYRNIAAAVLILIGISMLWDMGFGILRSYLGTDNPMIRSIYYFMRDVVPRAVMAVVIIWVGILLLKGKKVPVIESAEEAVPQIAQDPQNGQKVSDGQNSQNGTAAENDRNGQ